MVLLCARDGEEKKKLKRGPRSLLRVWWCCDAMHVRTAMSMDTDDFFYLVSRMGSLLTLGVREPARTAGRAAELVCSLSLLCIPTLFWSFVSSMQPMRDVAGHKIECKITCYLQIASKIFLCVKYISVFLHKSIIWCLFIAFHISHILCYHDFLSKSVLFCLMNFHTKSD